MISPIEAIAAAALDRALGEAVHKEAVLCAVLRRAGEALAELAGHEAAAHEHARHAYSHSRRERRAPIRRH